MSRAYPHTWISLAALSTWAWLVSWPIVALAQTASYGEADAAISKGIELRRQGKDEEALEVFRKAYRLAPSPRARAQIALSQQAIGRWAEAERDLADAMSHDQDPWIVRQRPILTEAMNVIRSHLGSLVVRGEPAGAVVEIDGELAGTIPMSERNVTAGEVAVTLRAPGYVSITRKVTVTPGQHAAEVFTLKRIDSDGHAEPSRGIAAQSESASSTAGVTPAVALSVFQPTNQRSAGSENYLRTAAWSIAIAGGLSVGAGVTFLFLANHNVTRFDDHCFIDADTGAVKGGGDCSDLNDSVHRDRVIGVVGIATGAALAATSGAFFYKLRDNPSQATSNQALISCVPVSTFGVSCTLQF